MVAHGMGGCRVINCNDLNQYFLKIPAPLEVPIFSNSDLTRASRALNNFGSSIIAFGSSLVVPSGRKRNVLERSTCCLFCTFVGETGPRVFLHQFSVCCQIPQPIRTTYVFSNCGGRSLQSISFNFQKISKERPAFHPILQKTRIDSRFWCYTISTSRTLHHTNCNLTTDHCFKLMNF